MKLSTLLLLAFALVLCGCDSSESASTATVADSTPIVTRPQTAAEYKAGLEKDMKAIKAEEAREKAPSSTSEPTRTFTEDSIEYHVAFVDAGGGVTPDGPETARVSRAMDRLQARFHRSRQHIADVFTKAHEYMAERGVSIPVVEIMEGLLNKGPKGIKDMEGLVAAYMTFETNGR